MQSTLISVIVPVYNISSYLDKCVQSILAQTYKNIELILVDDGSTDSCPAMCDEYAKKDNRVRVIHKKNGGLVTARKAGFMAAKGSYIMSVDGDDWIEEAMCSEMLNLIEKTGAECAVSGYIHETKGGNQKVVALDESEYFFDEETRVSVIENWLLGKRGIISPLWAKLYPSYLIRQSYSNVPDNMSQGEDFANFVNLLSVVRSIVCTSNTYYHYIYRKDSYSNDIDSHEFTNLHSMVAYCRNTIIKNYPKINKDVLDNWVVGQCIGNLKRMSCNSDFSIPLYNFKEIETLLGKKVIIYGAGAVGKDYIVQLCKYDNISIVAWVDKKYKNFDFEWKKVEPVSEILHKDYDIIIVAVKRQDMAEQITNELLEMKINKDKILWKEPQNMLEYNISNTNVERGGYNSIV